MVSSNNNTTLGSDATPPPSALCSRATRAACCLRPGRAERRETHLCLSAQPRVGRVSQVLALTRARCR
eukprot:COSAG04_NODE_22136_length_360_cov_1.555556_1_plen_67_part_10